MHIIDGKSKKLKEFLWLIILAMILFMTGYAFASDNQAATDAQKAIASAQNEFSKHLENLSAEQKAKEIQTLQAMTSKADLKKVLPEFYAKYVQPSVSQFRTDFNTTYCYNKCSGCGSKLSDAGVALTTTGACIAACLDSNRDKARSMGQMCLKAIKDHFYMAPEPPKPEIKQTVIAPQPTQQVQVPTPKVVINQPTVETSSCPPTQSALEKFGYLQAYLQGRIGPFGNSPYAQIIQPTQAQEEVKPQEAVKTSPEATPPQAQAQSKKEEEKDDNSGSSLLEGVLGAVEGLASGKGLAGAAHGFREGKQQADKEEEIRHQQRQYEKQWQQAQQKSQ